MPRPNMPESGAVLGFVKAWSGKDGDFGDDGTTASLDRACARSPRKSTGRDEGKVSQSNQGKLLTS